MWLIVWTQQHVLLISSPLSPSQKEYETNPSREQKNAAVFGNRISWRKTIITSLTEATAVSRTNVLQERKKSLLRMVETCICRPEIGPKHFDKLKPEPGSKAGPTRKFRLKTLVLIPLSSAKWPLSFAPSHPIHFYNRCTWNLSQNFAVVLSIIATVWAPSLCVVSASSTYQCLCSLKVNLQSPSMGMFLLLPRPHIYARVLSCKGAAC